MAKRSHHDIRRSLRDLRWPLRLTRLGLIAENGWRAFWPFLSLVMAVLAALMLGLQDSVLVEVVWAAAVVVAVGLLASLYYAARVFRWPSSGEALDRLDATLPGRPIQAMLDDQTIGASDPASAAVWRAHQSRMADRASAAKPVPADLRIARYDPYALRYGAAIFLVCALVFGSLGRVASVSELAPGDADALATGPVWEGWAESPRYTGRPTIYLNDIAEGPLALPVGTLITVRFYGEVGALTLAETVSGRVTDVGSAADPQQDFTIASEGQITISGPGGRVWDIAVLPDQAPNVAALRDPDVGPLGEMTLPFRAADDYGVEAGEARISLDLASVDRRHGLSLDPEARPEIVVPLPMPFAGSRASFEENLIEDFSEHPWANLPVSITLSVLDAAEQQGISEPRMISLPGRRFFDPLAAAIVEQRRDLLWNRGNADRIALILRAVAHLPDDVFRKETDQLRMRQLIRKLEMQASYGLSDEQQDQLAKDMWDFALKLEEGDLASALERLRQAQERLEQAMRDGASQDEIDRLMDEMRRATQDYLDQLSRQAQQEGQQNQQPGEQGDPQNQMQITQDDLQQMMDRIQELMEQGRMAEA
ncbi:MAG: DUF4175 family protein, partial [Rhodobacteraceae bacterium]|nr:DUF4175 family protein [Paracoccaceae bacterium]